MPRTVCIEVIEKSSDNWKFRPGRWIRSGRGNGPKNKTSIGTASRIKIGAFTIVISRRVADIHERFKQLRSRAEISYRPRRIAELSDTPFVPEDLAAGCYDNSNRKSSVVRPWIIELSCSRIASASSRLACCNSAIFSSTVFLQISL